MSQVGCGSDPHGSIYRTKEAGGHIYSGEPDLGFLLPLAGNWSDRSSQAQGRAAIDGGSQFTDASFRYAAAENSLQSALQNNFEAREQNTGFEANSGIDPLRLELRIKESQNESLENEIQRLRSSFNEALNFKQASRRHDSTAMEVPQSTEDVFRRLSTALHRKNEELVETKDTLESILTALALDPTNSVTKYGRYDAEALAHKVVTRIETLTRENQELAKMLAYGRAKEMQVQLQLAKLENSKLSEEISGLQRPDPGYKG